MYAIVRVHRLADYTGSRRRPQRRYEAWVTSVRGGGPWGFDSAAMCSDEFAEALGTRLKVGQSATYYVKFIIKDRSSYHWEYGWESDCGIGALKHLRTLKKSRA